MSIGGTINKVEELASTLQVCFDAGAKKVLLPMASAVELNTVPPELFAKFQISFYQSPEDAAFKALGVEWDYSWKDFTLTKLHIRNIYNKFK